MNINQKKFRNIILFGHSTILQQLRIPYVQPKSKTIFIKSEDDSCILIKSLSLKFQG